MYLREIGCNDCGLHSSGSEQEKVASSCADSNEP